MTRGEVSNSLTSLTLLNALEQGDDSRAWERFAARYEPMLLTFARRAGMSDSDAHDVVQETLIAFVEHMRTGRYDRERGRLRSWLRGVATNKLREAWRARGRREKQVVDESGVTRFVEQLPAEALGDLFEEEWERAVLAACMAEVRQQFDEQTMQAFTAYVLEEKAPDEVAGELGMTRNAVYICKTRVLSRLVKLREELFGDEADG